MRCVLLGYKIHFLKSCRMDQEVGQSKSQGQKNRDDQSEGRTVSHRDEKVGSFVLIETDNIWEQSTRKVKKHSTKFLRIGVQIFLTHFTYQQFLLPLPSPPTPFTPQKGYKASHGKPTKPGILTIYLIHDFSDLQQGGLVSQENKI